MSEEIEYINDVPEGYGGARCSFALRAPGPACGLPAWEGAHEEEPRCEFHSYAKPDDIKERLERAVASCVRLHGATLVKTDLSDADLRGAYLLGAKLDYADLSGADMEGADLCCASLYKTDLSGARLVRANVMCADLADAKLLTITRECADRCPDMRDADLMGVCLLGATISADICLDGVRFGPCPFGPEGYRMYDELLEQRENTDRIGCTRTYR